LAALASAIAEAAEQGESFDLADVDAVERLLEAALSVNGIGVSQSADLTKIAQAIAAVNEQLAASSGSGEEAVRAARFAFGDLQDLMHGIGLVARVNAEGGTDFLDISFPDDDS